MVNRIFDFHAHSIDPVDFTAAFNLSEELTFKPHDYIMDHTINLDENLEKTIEYFDKYNVDKALLNGPYTKDWISKYPDRFYKSTSVNLNGNIEEQVKQFEEEVKAKQTHCLGELGLTYVGLPLNTERLYPFYEICEKNGIPILLHSGNNGPQASVNMPHWKIANADPILFESVLSSFPKLKTVFAHFGFPFVNNTIYMLATYKSVYVDISVLNWLSSKSMFSRIVTESVETVGSKKILYGSDQMIWPKYIISKSIENTLNLPLNEEDIENIMYNSAVTLLNL